MSMDFQQIKEMFIPIYSSFYDFFLNARRVSIVSMENVPLHVDIRVDRVDVVPVNMVPLSDGFCCFLERGERIFIMEHLVEERVEGSSFPKGSFLSLLDELEIVFGSLPGVLSVVWNPGSFLVGLFFEGIHQGEVKLPEVRWEKVGEGNGQWEEYIFKGEPAVDLFLVFERRESEELLV